MHDQRRNLFLKRMDSEGIAVFCASASRTRNADTEFLYRPDSDFLYLTGLEEPEAVLILVPGRVDGEQILFLRKRDPKAEQWSGRRIGPEQAPSELGIAECHPIDDLEEYLQKLLPGRRTLYLKLAEPAPLEARAWKALRQLRNRPRRNSAPPARVEDPAEILHEMRLFKDDTELERMRKAVEITRQAHLAAARVAGDGVYEFEVESAIEHVFRRSGGVGPAYPSIVASGANATILHYVTNDRRMRGEELLLIDAGCEYEYYAADITRTYPVGGTYQKAQRAIYDLVLEAQKSALEECRAGRPFDRYHQEAVRVLADGLKHLGFLEGSLEEILEQHTYQKYYPHRTGHWLGLDVHDAGNYYHSNNQRHRDLEPGVVVTVEPGIYIPEDDETVPAEFRGIGVRIEDDVLITGAEPEVLSAEIPREAEEVEALTRA